jgi:hypothetical protein
MMAVASTFIMVAEIFLSEELMQYFGFTMKGKEMIVDEDLPPFLEAISLN